MKPVLKIGSTGSYVVECQQLLVINGFPTATDGIFGGGTEQQVKAFQHAKGLISDGIVGQSTWTALEASQGSSQGFDKCVSRYLPLTEGNYKKGPVNKVGVMIHHTVSDGSPDAVINGWNADSRGPVGTHFVIGRKMSSGEMKYDGEIVQCMHLEDWAYHIATTRMGFSSSHNENANKLYIGIELCSYGCLEFRNGKYYTMDGRNAVVPVEEVCVLERPWRTYQYWHKYTPAQMESLKKLLKALHGKVGIDLMTRPYDPPVNWEWFDLSWEMLNFRRKVGIHSNMESGKFDSYPQPELMQVLKELYG
jgi:N-acetyl-anhydromuramyl-L-alanine amidase AmpD